MYFVCFPQNFQKSDSKFFHAKIENQSFWLMGWSYLATFNFRCEKAAKVFCKMSQKVYPERPFEFRLSICFFLFQTKSSIFFSGSAGGGRRAPTGRVSAALGTFPRARRAPVWGAITRHFWDPEEPPIISIWETHCSGE